MSSKTENSREIFVDKVSEEALNELEDNKILVIKHPHLQDVQISVGKEAKVEEFLGAPVRLLSVDNKVWDNTDKVFPVHKLSLTNKEIAEYITELLNCETLASFKYCRALKEKNLKINDVVEFNNGKKGVIYKEPDMSAPTNARYTLLKKDGNLSKCLPRLIYAGMEYKVVGRHGE